MILPIDYVDIEIIIKIYGKKDSFYGSKIDTLYREFKRVISNCQLYTGDQQLYILIPISFYNLWKEISCKSLIPKYFPEKLYYLSETLDMILPAQRNIYMMLKSNESSFNSMYLTIQENFGPVKTLFNKCHKRIDWIKDVNDIIGSKTESKELFYLLSPIIFSVSNSVDISDTYHDDENARIGLCFGVDMPVNFFVSRGLTEIEDIQLKSVTHILNV